MKLIIISWPEAYSDEIKIINQLFQNGLELFHLRKPDWSIQNCRTLLEGIDKNYHSKIVIHQHYLLSREFNLRGIHLQERVRKSGQELLDYKIISSSFHQLDELREEKYSYEYVFLSPIFDSISKEGYKSQFDLEELKGVLPEVKQNVIALGGIKTESLSDIKKVGFKGVAILGAFWQSADPLKIVSHILG